MFGDFNARIGGRRPGEEDVFGEFTYGREAQHAVELPNRDLLVEFCLSKGLAVANTFADVPAHQKVTYHEPGTRPMEPISDKGFNVMDLLLVPVWGLHKVRSICSDRLAAIASHHFPVVATLDAILERRPARIRTAGKKEWASLKESRIRQAFVEQVSEKMTSSTLPPDACRWKGLGDIIAAASEQHVPIKHKTGNKPWITETTLSLIEARNLARCHADWEAELRLRKEIRCSVRQDRSKW